MENTQFVVNVSKADIESGYFPGSNTEVVLISITDPCCGISKHSEKYSQVFKFEFLDIEEADHDFNITEDQAREIAKILFPHHPGEIHEVLWGSPGRHMG